MRDSAGRPHVLIVVENLPVPLDRRVWQESGALRDRGYDVTVICPQMRGFVAPDETLDGIRILRHPISGEAGGFWGFLREYASALRGERRLAARLWREKPFDVIHLCNPPDLLFLVAWPYRRRGVRVIYDVHDLWPEMFEAKFRRRGLFYRAVRLAERLTYAAAHVVIATNGSVRNVALTRGKKRPEDVFVVRTAPTIPAGSFAPDPALKKGRAYLAAYIGVMGSTDGVDRLIDAADHLVHRMGRRDIQFLLMGAGPEFDALVRRRDARGLADFVDMPGRVTNEFLFTALATMDAGVACDPPDGYNDHCTMNKTLEYMAFGKPQVMFEIAEGRASAGEAAAYVKGGSPEDLARAVAELMDDPARRERMGRIGRERLAGELGWDRSVESLAAAYARALGSRAAGPDIPERSRMASP